MGCGLLIAMLRKLFGWLLMPVFLILALMLPEDVDEDLRAEQEAIERAKHERRQSH